MRGTKLLSLILIMGAALLAFSPTGASAATGSISGIVTDGSDAPLDQICVEAYDSNGIKSGTGRSRSDGTYRLDGLEAGDHRVGFDPYPCGGDKTMLPEFYEDKVTLAEATPVTVASGSDTPGVDVELAKGGSISGTMNFQAPLGFGSAAFSPDGPGIGSSFCLYEAHAFDSGGNPAGRGDPAGSPGYKIVGLRTGEYRIEFAQYCYGAGALREFYENKGTLEDATPVSVTAGADTPGIDATLAPNGSISGTVTNETGDPQSGICVVAYDSEGDFDGGSQTDSTGDYTVDQLESGSHRLLFWACDGSGTNLLSEYYDNKQTYAEATPVMVNHDSETAGLVTQLAPGATISGRVSDEMGDPLIDLCVTAHGQPQMTFFTEMATDKSDANGAYTLAGLPTGDYRLEFSGCGSTNENMIGEFYDNQENLEQATPVSAAVGVPKVGIDAELVRRETPDVTPPGTVIDSGPSGTITTNHATFTFSSTEPPETAEFECGIDSGDFADCTSPKTVSSLAEGPHTVAVRARDAAGNRDPSPATRTFEVNTTKYKAAISKVSVRGPARVRKNRKVAYRVKINNTGNATATGVRLKVSGRGVRSERSVARILPASTRTVTISLKPKHRGKTKLTFRLDSSNAGTVSVTRPVFVRR